jgi:putative SOS response-associated peptidase YedK
MCGRFTLRTPLTVLMHHFNIDARPDQQQVLFEPRYNIPPTVDVPVVRFADGHRTLSLMRWGLLPSWTKDPKKAPLLNNARAESVAEKPSFRTAFKKRRCLIPVDGFYEWKTIGKAKQPYYFHRQDERPFAFAGLWEAWNEIESCTIITTDANEVMAPIHHRMPVVLVPNDYKEWLDPEASELEKLLIPCPADELICYPVDK